jgi:hypothetical protein
LKIKFPTNVIFFNKIFCPNIKNYLFQQQLNAQAISQYNRNIQNRPTIEQIEASRARERRQHFAIKNYYKNKSRKK